MQKTGRYTCNEIGKTGQCTGRNSGKQEVTGKEFRSGMPAGRRETVRNETVHSAGRKLAGKITAKNHDAARLVRHGTILGGTNSASVRFARMPMHHPASSDATKGTPCALPLAGLRSTASFPFSRKTYSSR